MSNEEKLKETIDILEDLSSFLSEDGLVVDGLAEKLVRAQEFSSRYYDVDEGR